MDWYEYYTITVFSKKKKNGWENKISNLWYILNRQTSIWVCSKDCSMREVEGLMLRISLKRLKRNFKLLQCKKKWKNQLSRYRKTPFNSWWKRSFFVNSPRNWKIISIRGAIIWIIYCWSIILWYFAAFYCYWFAFACCFSRNHF